MLYFLEWCDIFESGTKGNNKNNLQLSQQWDILDEYLGFVNKRGITVKQDGCLKSNRLQSKKVTVQFSRLGQLQRKQIPLDGWAIDGYKAN